MSNLTNEQKKKVALTPYIPLYAVSKLWRRIKTTTNQIKTSLAYAYYSSVLWTMERFITCEYPMAHKRYGKIFKNKIKLEYARYYTGKIDYNIIFDPMWRLASDGNNKNKELATFLLRANLLLLSNNSLSTMCGIQPMVGPVGQIFKLRYTKEPEAVGDGGTRLSLEVLSGTVEARTRILKSSVSVELFHDLEHHQIEPEPELAHIMTNSVNQEYIDVFCDMVLSECETVNVDLTTKDDNPLYTSTSVTLHLNRVANEIGRDTRRGTGNVLWVSPVTLCLLESSSTTAFSPCEHREDTLTGVTFVGTLNAIKVYEVLLPDGIDAIIGYKGRTETDAGIIMAPYTPLLSSGFILDEETMNPRMSFMTRYGIKTFKDDIDGLGDWNTYYKAIRIKYPETGKKSQLLQEAA